MTNARHGSLKEHFYIAGFIPIIFIGDIYIYYYSILSLFILKIELHKTIDFYKLLIYSLGFISLLINQDIKIFLSILLIFIYDEMLVVEYTKYVELFYYIICLIVLVFFFINYGGRERIEFFNNNVFNAVLFIYISIFSQNLKTCFISLPFILLFVSRTSLISWLVWFLSYKVIKNNNKKTNFIALFFGIGLFFYTGLLDKIDITKLPYHQSFDRVFLLNDNSLGSRINQYIYFINNLDYVQFFTKSEIAYSIATNYVMEPHSTVATLLTKGGIFYLMFIYMIAAYRVRATIFLPIFFASLVLHSAFIAHILILIEKFKESYDEK